MEKSLKRTQDDVSGGEDERNARPAPPAKPRPLEKYVFTMRKKWPSTSGKNGVIAKLNQNPSYAYHIATAHVSSDLRTLRTKILPEYNGITYTRDKNYYIDSIADEHQAVKGPKLDRLVINHGAGLVGMCEVVYQGEVGSDDHSGLTIPAHNVAEYSVTIKGSAEDNEEDTTLEGRCIIMKATEHKLILPPEDVSFLANLPNIKLTSLPSVFKALSALRKVDAKTEINKFTNLESVTLARRSELKRNQVALLDSLEAAFLESSSMADKIAAFVQNPTFAFLSKLKIKRAFSKPLFAPDGSKVPLVQLSKLAPDARILLQDMTIDPNYYEKCLNSSLTVYVPGDYRIKAGKHLKVLGPQDEMTAGQIRQIIQAKETALIGPQAQAVAVQPVIEEGAGDGPTLALLDLDI